MNEAKRSDQPEFTGGPAVEPEAEQLELEGKEHALAVRETESCLCLQ